MKATSFEDLKIWQNARELSKEIYAVTRLPEFSKDYRFVGQITAAIGSVMDNMQRDLREMVIKSFYNSYLSLKALAERLEVKYTEPLMLDILTRKLFKHYWIK